VVTVTRPCVPCKGTRLFIPSFIIHPLLPTTHLGLVVMNIVTTIFLLVSASTSAQLLFPLFAHHPLPTIGRTATCSSCLGSTELSSRISPMFLSSMPTSSMPRKSATARPVASPSASYPSCTTWPAPSKHSWTRLSSFRTKSIATTSWLPPYSFSDPKECGWSHTKVSASPNDIPSRLCCRRTRPTRRRSFRVTRLWDCGTSPSRR
jgi:hypothetical protein